MKEAPDALAVLRCALSIIQERGWSKTLSIDSTSPINLREAIANGCTKIVGGGRSEWYDTYIATVQALSKYLKRGIHDWESKVKTPSEVEAMLTEVINRMEANVTA